jgi:hypothetical protein
VFEAARRLPQPKRQRLQIVLARDTKRARLRGAVFHQDVAETKARLLDDLLKQDRGIHLGRKRADVIDRYRLADAGDDIGVGVEIAAQRRVEHRRVANIGGGCSLDWSSRHRERPH